jgi:hypothetical protein
MAQKYQPPFGSMTDDEFWRRGVEKRVREHYEEESERARLDIEPSANEYKKAEEEGDHHPRQAPSEIADASDIAGG